MALSKNDESDDSTQNKISERLKSIAVLLGQGKVIYSAVFLSVLFLYKIELINTISDTYYFVLVILWGCLLLINTKTIHSRFSLIEPDKSNNSIGEIFSVQSDKMFLVKLFEDKKYIKKFDLVNFKYQMDDYADIVNKGFVFDTYNLNKQKWAKVLLLQKDKDSTLKLKSNTIYKISDSDIKTQSIRALQRFGQRQRQICEDKNKSLY
jgi:predicted DNA-binding protein (MmcQ/YjbR family)